MTSFQKFLHCLESEVKSKGKHTNCTPNTKPASNEVPKAENIVWVYSEFRSLWDVSRASTDMLFSDQSSICDSKFGILGDQPLFATFGIQDSLSSCECF